jgi:hypothetical protein
MLLSAPVCCYRDSSDVDVTLTGGPPRKLSSRRCRRVYRTTAGLTYPLTRLVHRRKLPFSHVAGAFTNHGGLTPAAPGNVRSCIAKGVISPANDRAATKSGGRQPPVECTQRMRTRSAEIRRIGIADGVYKPTAGLRPPLLVTCVRASQKALFHRRTIVQQPRAGGVSPPWPAIVRDTTNRRYTSVTVQSHPHIRPIAGAVSPPCILLPSLA